MKRAGIVWIAAASLAAAADPAPVELSLKRAVEIATSTEGSAKIQLAEEALKQADARRLETRAALLPHIDGNLNVRNQTVNLQTFGLDVRDRLPGIVFPTFVGPFTTIDARVSGSQTVFDFSSIRRYQASKENVSAAKSDVNANTEQVAAQVAKAYMAALKAAADVETAEANVKLSQALQSQAEHQKEAGTGTGIEVTRAQVQLANDRQNLVRLASARRISQYQLLRAMGIRMDADLTLTDKLEFVPIDAITVQEARKLAFDSRPDLRAQMDRESNARLNSSATKMERLPSLSAFGDYGSSGTAITNALPTRTVGLSVNVPIFDGGRREARRAESTIQFRSEQVRTGDLKEQIELEVRSALESLHSGEEQVRVAREGVGLANNELDHARRRYDAGVAAGIEVTDAQTRLERALDNQTVALYNYNVARVDLAQATGKVREMTR